MNKPHRAMMVVVLIGLLTNGGAMADSFRLTSPQLSEGSRIADEQLFNLYGCQGENLSPALEWSNPPAGTKSFAVTVYDLDVPTGGDWWHWVIFNIPVNVQRLDKGAGDPRRNLAPPGAIQTKNDFGQMGYGGPCPPPGDKPHRYEFTVYALKVDRLPADGKSPAATVSYYLQQNMVGKATLKGVYGR